MKSLLLGLALLVSIPSFGATLVCLSEEPSLDNSGVVVMDKLKAECVDFDSGDDFTIEIKSGGPTLRYSMLQGFTLICPFRSGDRLKGKYYGAKLEAEVALGLRGGLFYAKDKACILGGAQIGALGVAATLGTLEIR